jgi:DNA uptake protein ComE-like DNA-binding protein
VALMAGAAVADGVFGYFGQQQTNAANAAEAQKNRDFQEHMSNTAYQRQVEDMRKAGINPMLISGTGASTPSGAMPSGMQSSLGAGISSALDTAKFSQAVKQTDSQVKLQGAQQDAARNQAQVNLNTARKAAADADVAEAMKPAGLVEAKNRLERAKADATFQTYDSWLDRAIRTAGGVGTAVNVFSKGVMGRKPGGPMGTLRGNPSDFKLETSGSDGVPVP